MSKQEKNTQKKDNSKPITVLLILLVLGLVTYPAIIIICFLAFLPTFVAFLTDTSRNHSLIFCVGISNFAAFIPCIHELYESRFSMAATSQMLHDPLSILLILGGASVGWLIHLSVPIITINFYQSHDKNNLDKLVAKYTALKQSWGDVIPESEAIDSLIPKREEDENEDYI